MTTRRLSALVAGLAVLALSACGDDAPDEAEPTGDDGPAATSNFTEPDDAQTETEPEPAVFGTFDDPLPVGTVVTLTDWEITISPPSGQGDGAAGGDEDEINLIAPASAVRIGGEAGTLSGELGISVIGGDGIEHSDTVACPDLIDDYADVYPGAELTGALCPLLPESAVDGAVWKIEETWGGDVAYVSVN